MTSDQRDDAALDRLLSTGQRPEPSPDFMARLQADMETALHDVQQGAPVPSAPPRQSWLAGIFAASGLAGATLAGIWIGFAMPETLDSFTAEAETTLALSSILPGADLGSVFDE